MPPAPQPRAKKSGNGCLVALGIIGGLAGLMALLVGVGLWRFSSTPEGKKVFGAMGEAVRIATEAQSAPGAAEVRALGCDQAMVVDVRRMAKIFEQLDASTGEAGFSVMVVCQVGLVASSPPSCDAVARAYHAATRAPQHPATGDDAGPGALPFVASVTRGGGRGGEICSTLYDVDGKRLRDLAKGSTPTIPGAR